MKGVHDRWDNPEKRNAKSKSIDAGNTSHRENPLIVAALAHHGDHAKVRRARPFPVPSVQLFHGPDILDGVQSRGMEKIPTSVKFLRSSHASNK